MVRLLMHQNLAVRVRSAITLTLVLLMLIWSFSALLLPQGIIRLNAGSWLAHLPVLPSALVIFAMNLLNGACGTVLMNQWRTGRGLATGYYLLLLRSSVFHGVLRGTNSFTFPYASQREIIFGFFRVGLWETLALSLICAATASLAGYPTSSPDGLFSFYRFIRNPADYLTKKELTAILAGIALLALAALMEALNILVF